MLKAAVAEPDDPATLVAQCRQLVRNLSTPGRLRSNPLAQAIMERPPVGRDPSCALKEAVGDALELLPAHDRRIIERCDLDHEIHALVAAELRISERHLYRERQRIFERLAVLLLAARAQPPALRVDAIDSVEQLVKTSLALEENGAYGGAVELLERRALESVDQLERARLFSRIAMLHANAGLPMRADESLTMAHRNAASVASPSALIDAELALTDASILESRDAPAPLIIERTDRSVQLVLSTQSAQYDQAAAAVLVRALALRAKTATFTGDVQVARDSVVEARASMPNLHHADTESRIVAFIAESFTRVICEGDLSGAAQSLGHGMRVAQDSGFSLSSVNLALLLADLYLLRRDPGRAVAILTARLDIARVLGNRNVLGSLLIHLADAYLQLRDYSRATHALDEATDVVEGDCMLLGRFLRVTSVAKLCTRQFGQALDASRAAARVHESEGRIWPYGMSLVLAAEALFMTGERRSARAKIREAIDVLSVGGHRLALGRAHRVMARISGNLIHLETARRLAKPS